MSETASGKFAEKGPQGLNISDVITGGVDGKNIELWHLNQTIFNEPELAFKEFKAHDNIVRSLLTMGFDVTPHAYGLETSFMATYGSGGRLVVFNAEYDALPDIGHGCGHNLIAVSSLAAFIGVAAALQASGIPGRVRVLGTPAEEGGGGKEVLLSKGAYEGADACLMAHPGPALLPSAKLTGAAYLSSLAMAKLRVEFRGKPAHAAIAPSQGINALDAACLTYSAVSMLRQQINEYERIHSVIVDGGTYSNVIPASTISEYQVRSKTQRELELLKERVKNCFRGAAMATGCTVDIKDEFSYSDLRPNKTLCAIYAEAMAALKSPVLCDLAAPPLIVGSTDQGNVSYACPSFQVGFVLDTVPGAFNHTPGFATAAATEEAHHRAMEVAKGMAATAWSVLSDDQVAAKAQNEFLDNVKTMSF
ncbi:hypothetical protein BX600DRAFT_443889 [Xylariales sp. PMI_506]|nr:hypothetical protein BX600DRAFT_443889 [Xylariales sp. PMI_506]